MSYCVLFAARGMRWRFARYLLAPRYAVAPLPLWTAAACRKQSEACSKLFDRRSCGHCRRPSASPFRRHLWRAALSVTRWYATRSNWSIGIPRGRRCTPCRSWLCRARVTPDLSYISSVRSRRSERGNGLLEVCSSKCRTRNVFRSKGLVENPCALRRL